MEEEPKMEITINFNERSFSISGPREYVDYQKDEILELFRENKLIANVYGEDDEYKWGRIIT
mgnify:CR=1 FL=1